MALPKKAFCVIAVCILGLACVISKAFAQRQEIAFKHLSTVDGLSNFTVLSIAQDHQGFMWFGTMDGLNRFDGKEIKTYREDPEDSNSLGNNYVFSLYCNSDSGIWVGTNRGLYFYDFNHDSFRPIPVIDSSGNEQNNLVVHALVVKDDYLWVGANQGLYKYNLTKAKYIPVEGSGKTIGRVNALKMSDDGSLWIGHTQGLTKYQDGRFRDMPIDELLHASPDVISIEIDDTGKIWMGTSGLKIGLIIYDPDTDSIVKLSKKDRYLPHNRVNCLFNFMDGKIWAGTTWGMAILDQNTYHSRHLLYEKENPRSISQNSIKAIFQGKDGIVWIGTYSGGVNYFDSRSQLINHVTDKYNNEHLLNFNIVSSIFEDRDKNLWIGTEYGGVNIYNPTTKRFSIIKEEAGKSGLVSDNIKSIIEDRRGRKFIATQFGLSIYGQKNNSFINVTDQQGKHGKLNYKAVFDLCMDKYGNIWVGATGEDAHFQMYDIQKDTLIHFYPPEQNFPTINNAFVNSMVYDEKHDVVWTGGNNGLAGFNIQTKTYITNDEFRSAAKTLQTIIINDLFLDSNGLLWMATFGRGLFIMDVKTYQLRKIAWDEGLLERSFYAIVDDDYGNIWTSANSHLLKIKRPGNINQPITHIEKFDVQEGFPPQQYFRTAKCKGADGTLYFGGDDGYISFDPQKVENIVFYPSVAITDILINGKPLKIEANGKGRYLNVASLKNISLTYDQSSFAVHFIAPNYNSPENTWYQYQLSGIYDAWQDLGNSNTINFTTLKAGNYELKLRASSDPYNFKEGFTSINLSISPPYWASPWAYIIYVIVVILFLYVFFVISRNWERLSQNLRLEYMQRKKEEEFHQQRIKFFTDISHELRTPLTLILAPLERIIKSNFGNAKIKNQLMLMWRNGDRMLQLINQLLDLRKLETGHVQLKAAKGDISKFIREVSLSFRELANNRDIEFNVVCKSRKVIVWFDHDKFEIILFNLLSNALKFTPDKGKISVYIGSSIEGQGDMSKGLQVNKGKVIIRIENSGRGIMPENMEHVFERFYAGQHIEDAYRYSSGVGLEIVKNLVDLHKGKISVSSSYNEDGINGLTCFTVALKKGKGHFSGEELLKEYKSSEDIANYGQRNANGIEVGDLKYHKEEIDISIKPKEQTILIVEDNPEVRNLVASIFKETYNVIEASNGEEGWDLAKTKIPDLIISDIMMPGMDGIELCRIIKKDVNTSHIPVILLTARTAVTFKYEGLETGADDYIVKPFSIENLSIRAKNLIKQRKLLREHFEKSNPFIPTEVTFTSVDENMMHKTIDYIMEQIDNNDLTVEKIAEEVGMSRANFYRKIKSLTNMTAVEFLRKIKMEHAANLLKTNKIRVSEVRHMVGISDADYFRDCFKRQFGMTPKEYIESH